MVRKFNTNADATELEILADAEALAQERKIVVEITPAREFTAAEKYHQNFYKKNPAHYYRYRLGCRRDQRIEQIWGKAAKS